MEINVSSVLKNLGIENTVLGFVSSFTGKQIEEMVKEVTREEIECLYKTIGNIS